MSGKRRHHERLAQREDRAERERLEAIARGVGVHFPALAPSGSYDRPGFMRRGYYVDEPFDCRDCGASQVWTAERQKWWYEVAKGDVFSTATRCRECRRRERERREAAQVKGKGGDPNPFKSAGRLFAEIHHALELELREAGFELTDRNTRQAWWRCFLEYQRSDGLLAIFFDPRRGLVAEWLSEGGDSLRPIACVDFSSARSTPAIEHRLAPFLQSVRSFLTS